MPAWLRHSDGPANLEVIPLRPLGIGVVFNYEETITKIAPINAILIIELYLTSGRCKLSANTPMTAKAPVGIFTFVPEKGGFERVVVARMGDDGVCVLEGNEIICGRLRADGVIVVGNRYLPEDGEKFLKALTEVFRNPYLKAVPLNDSTS